MAEPSVVRLENGLAGAGTARGPWPLLRQRLSAMLLRYLDVLDERSAEATAQPSVRGGVARRDVARALDPPALMPHADGQRTEPPTWSQIVDESLPWKWLRDSYGLSEAELDLVLVAFACELDLEYERAFAYLQDDQQRRSATVDLALRLISSSPADQLTTLSLVGADAPLMRQRVIHLVADPRPGPTPLLASQLELDAQLVDVLLKQSGLDRRLVPWCQLISEPPTDAAHRRADPMVEALRTLVAGSSSNHPLRLHFSGPLGESDKLAIARLVAHDLGAPLLYVGMDRLPVTDGLSELLTLIFREADLHGAILFLGESDGFWEIQTWARQAFVRQLAHRDGVTILAGAHHASFGSDEPIGFVAIPFPAPSFVARRTLWERALTDVGLSLGSDELNTLTDRYALTPSQIREAALTAHNLKAWATVDPVTEVTDGGGALEALSVAVRALTGQTISGLAQRIEPVHGWDDLVLPAEPESQLRDLCGHVSHRHQVLDDWGFGRRLAGSKGVSALFSGSPGTGKTMAAAVIARELRLDLYKIELSSVVSKYIGETEKNLEEIFAAATTSNAILLFDEAEALFGKRSEVRDSHDRYANIEVAYLLQRMERYDGLAILTTNLREHLDDAFLRRLQFVVEFPFPAEEDRRRIWQGCFPADAPMDDDVDVAYLARTFPLPGGNIKNVVIAAAFLAAAGGSRIGMRHLLQATSRELAKMGKVEPGTELRMTDPEFE